MSIWTRKKPISENRFINLTKTINLLQYMNSIHTPRTHFIQFKISRTLVKRGKLSNWQNWIALDVGKTNKFSSLLIAFPIIAIWFSSIIIFISHLFLSILSCFTGTYINSMEIVRIQVIMKLLPNYHFDKDWKVERCIFILFISPTIFPSSFKRASNSFTNFSIKSKKMNEWNG